MMAANERKCTQMLTQNIRVNSRSFAASELLRDRHLHGGTAYRLTSHARHSAAH